MKKKQQISQLLPTPLQFHEIKQQIDSLNDTAQILTYLISQCVAQLEENQIIRIIPVHAAQYAVNCIHTIVQQGETSDEIPTNDHEDREPALPKSEAMKNFSVQINPQRNNELTDRKRQHSSSSLKSKQKGNSSNRETQEFRTIRPISLNILSIQKQILDDPDEPYRQIHQRKIQKIEKEQEQDLFIQNSLRQARQIQAEVNLKKKQLTHMNRITNKQGYTYDYSGGFLQLRVKHNKEPPQIYQVEYNLNHQASKSVLIQDRQQEYILKNSTARVLHKQSAAATGFGEESEKSDKKIEEKMISQSRYLNHNIKTMTDQEKTLLLQNSKTRLTKDEYYEIKDIQDRKIRQMKYTPNVSILRQKTEQAVTLPINNTSVVIKRAIRQSSQGSIHNFQPDVSFVMQGDIEEISGNINHLNNKLNRTRSGFPQKFLAPVSFEEGGLPPIQQKYNPILSKALNNSIKLPRQRQKVADQLLKQKRSISQHQ